MSNYFSLQLYNPTRINYHYNPKFELYSVLFSFMLNLMKDLINVINSKRIKNKEKVSELSLALFESLVTRVENLVARICCLIGKNDITKRLKYILPFHN